MTMTVTIISVMIKMLIERTGRWKGCLPMTRSVSLTLTWILRRKKCCQVFPGGHMRTT